MCSFFLLKKIMISWFNGKDKIDIVSQYLTKTIKIIIIKETRGEYKMNVYDLIVQKYRPGSIIFLSELNKLAEGEIKQPTLRKQIERLVVKEKLVRIDGGVYIYPEKSTITGKFKAADIKKVIEKKYIEEENKKIGYYSGLTLLRQLGICNQIPNIDEIVTNKEKSNRRIAKISYQKVILKKSKVRIDNNNVETLQFLDLLRIIDDYRDSTKDWAQRQIIKKYRGKVTLDKITKYIKYFPNKVAKKIMEYKIYEILA